MVHLSHALQGGAVSGKGTKKGKKSSKVVSLKNAPFLLKDGDIIGVKVCSIMSP